MKDRSDERTAAHEAASAAVTAVVRRAELENENEALLSELVDIKVSFANMSVDFDKEIKRNAMLKKRLQLYAETVNKMELKGTSVETKTVGSVSSNGNSKANGR
jgi:hypothetical protein